jgi:hypothetical protein
MAQYVVVEKDSDGDVVQITGPFSDQQSAMLWLRVVRAPSFAKNWQDQIGAEIKTEWHPSGCYIHADCDPQSFDVVVLGAV